MMIKQKILLMMASVGIVSLSLVAVASPNASAIEKCAGIETSIIKCDPKAKDDKGKDSKAIEQSGAWKLLVVVIRIMTAGVGVLAVGGIVYGSILYTTAGDKAEQTKKAVGIITNVAIGIISYGLMFLLLNYLIPGGIFDVSR